MLAVRFARRALGLLVIAIAGFTIYGSLVPFEFHARPVQETTNAFQAAMQNWRSIESRSDALVNTLLGIPLGFGLLGLFRAGTVSRLGDLGVGAALLPACLLFAATVEFAQLYVPERTCSGSDVLCQGLGAVLGMAGWIAGGRWLVVQAEATWSGADAAGRLLIAYLALLAFIQLLPMDLSGSPRDLYRKLRDNVVVIPFAEFRDAAEEKVLSRAGRLLQMFGLYVPVGLLAATRCNQHGGLFTRRAPTVHETPSHDPTRLILLAIAVAFFMECLQLIVRSRTSSATDVVMGVLGTITGWWIARSTLPLRIVCGVVWFLGLAFISWQPFVVGSHPVPFDWLPGMPLESGNPLFALEEMLTKLVLFALAGTLCRSVFRASLLGLAASAVFEAGQTAFLSHTPSITDVLLGAVGTAIGCRVRQLTLSEAGAGA